MITRRLHRLSILTGGVIALLLSPAAFAEFKTFEEVVQSEPPAEVRLENIKSYFSAFRPFEDLDEVSKRGAFAMAASRVIVSTCGQKSEKSVQYPPWAVSALSSDYLTTEVENPSSHPTRVLAWGVVGMMMSDSNPCEIAGIGFM